MTPQDVYEMLYEVASDDCVFCGTTNTHLCLLPKTTRYAHNPPLTDFGVYASSSPELAMVEAVINARGWQWWCTNERTHLYTVSIPRMSSQFLNDGYVHVLSKKLFNKIAPMLFYSAISVIPKYSFKLNAWEMADFLKKRGVKFRVC